MAAFLSLAAAAQPARAAAVEPAFTMTGRMLSPWPAFQRGDGSFPDYIVAVTPTNSNRYGESMLGASMIRHGMKAGSSRLITPGLKAIDFALRNRNRSGIDSASRLFDDLALVEAWLAVTRRGSRVRVPAATAVLWRSELGSIVPLSDKDRWNRPSNQVLVEQLKLLELLASGVKPVAAGSPLRDAAAARRLASATITRVLDQTEAAAVSDTAVGPASLVGDEPDFPPAYHALTVAILARLTNFMGFDKPLEARVRALVSKATTAAAVTIAPDGDFAYGGRSSQEAWTLTMLVAAARQASLGCSAACPATGAAARIESLTLSRLAAKHVDPKWGLRLFPAMATGLLGVKAAIDSYISATSYTGLALLGLTWAEYTTPAPVAEWAGLDREAIGAGRGGVGVSRTADSWFAVRSGSLAPDPRLASGVVAAKALVAGKWVDIVVAPPGRAASTGTYGPLLIDGWTVGAMPSPSVATVEGGLRLAGKTAALTGSPASLVADMDVTLEHVQCGLRVTVPQSESYGVAFAVNVPATKLTRTAPGVLDWPVGTVTAGAGDWVEWAPSGPTTASATTNRVMVGTKAGASGPVVITVAAKGCTT